jgi:hypothetical protein
VNILCQGLGANLLRSCRIQSREEPTVALSRPPPSHSTTQC